MLLTIRAGRRKQDKFEPSKYKYSRPFDDLPLGYTHIVVVVKFGLTSDELRQENNFGMVPSIKLLLLSYRRLVEASRKAPLPLDGLDSVPETVRNTVLRVAQREPVASFLQVMTEGTVTVPTSRLPQVFTAKALKAVA